MENIKEVIRERVSQIATASWGDQSRIARAIDMDRSQFSRYLEGKGDLKGYQIHALALLTNRSADWFLGLTDDPVAIKVSELNADERALLALAVSIDGGPVRAIKLLARGLSRPEAPTDSGAQQAIEQEPHSPVDPGWSKPLGQRTIKRPVSSPVPSGKGMAGKQPK